MDLELSLYRRHEGDCKRGPRDFNRCDCPIWCDGTRAGKRTRRSMKTRSWSEAKRRVEKLATGQAVPILETGKTVSEVVTAYIADCERRKLAPATVARYRLILEPLVEAFPSTKVRQLDVEMLGDYQAVQDRANPGSGRLALIVLRMLLSFALDRKWIDAAEGNPAKKLKAPKYESAPTLPFERKDVARMLVACDRLTGGNPLTMARTRARAKALLLVLLYSGLRISDAVKLERAALDFSTGKLRLRIMKTGVPLYVTLQRPALDALRALPVESPLYFFQSGKGKLITAINSANHTIKAVAKLASVGDAHAHRFRDTFAVELLLNGTEVRTVQKLLGHASVEITEAHYTPWVAGMQRALDAATGTLDFTTQPS